MAHGVAVNAYAVWHVGGLVDQRLLRQALGHRRQRAGIDIFGRDPVRFVIFGQRPVLENIAHRHEDRLALGGKFRRIGQLARQFLRRNGQHGHGQQKSCPAKGINRFFQQNLPSQRDSVVPRASHSRWLWGSRA